MKSFYGNAVYEMFGEMREELDMIYNIHCKFVEAWQGEEDALEFMNWPTEKLYPHMEPAAYWGETPHKETEQCFAWIGYEWNSPYTGTSRGDMFAWKDRDHPKYPLDQRPYGMKHIQPAAYWGPTAWPYTEQWVEGCYAGPKTRAMICTPYAGPSSVYERWPFKALYTAALDWKMVEFGNVISEPIRHYYRPSYWGESPRADGRMEWKCEHGVGHGGIHGCCWPPCCNRPDFPGTSIYTAKGHINLSSKGIGKRPHYPEGNE